jgi:predicted dinucleotide-binding enzyme
LFIQDPELLTAHCGLDIQYIAKAFARSGIEVSVATTRDPESFASAAAAIVTEEIWTENTDVDIRTGQQRGRWATAAGDDDVVRA